MCRRPGQRGRRPGRGPVQQVGRRHSAGTVHMLHAGRRRATLTHTHTHAQTPRTAAVQLRGRRTPLQCCISDVTLRPAVNARAAGGGTCGRRQAAAAGGRPAVTRRSQHGLPPLHGRSWRRSPTRLRPAVVAGAAARWDGGRRSAPRRPVTLAGRFAQHHRSKPTEQAPRRWKKAEWKKAAALAAPQRGLQTTQGHRHATPGGSGGGGGGRG